MDLLSIAKDFGPFVAMVVFYVWDSRKQRAAMSKRIDAQIDFAQTTLTKLVEENQKVITENTEVMKRILNNETLRS